MEKLQCSITGKKYLRGEVQCTQIKTEMEHLNSDTKMQQGTDDICSSKGSLQIFHQNVHSVRNKKVNLKILLYNNFSTVDVLGVIEHWLLENEISCYNLPYFLKNNSNSLISIKCNLLAKPITNFVYLNLDEYFEVTSVKLIHFKLFIIVYIEIQILIDNIELVLRYLDKMKDQVIMIGDLKINFFKNASNESKKLEVLLSMFVLQAVINVPTRIYKKQNPLLAK